MCPFWHRSLQRSLPRFIAGWSLSEITKEKAGVEGNLEKMSSSWVGEVLVQSLLSLIFEWKRRLRFLNSFFWTSTPTTTLQFYTVYISHLRGCWEDCRRSRIVITSENFKRTNSSFWCASRSRDCLWCSCVCMSSTQDVHHPLPHITLVHHSWCIWTLNLSSSVVLPQERHLRERVRQPKSIFNVLKSVDILQRLSQKHNDRIITHKHWFDLCLLLSQHLLQTLQHDRHQHKVSDSRMHRNRTHYRTVLSPSKYLWLSK